MKKKSKKAVPQKTSQFRYHKVNVPKDNGTIITIWHPTFIFLIIGNVYRYVLLTHSEKIDGEVLVEIVPNPNSKDKRPSYRMVGYKEDTKDRFGRKLHGWKMPITVEIEIRKNKKR